MTTTFCKLFALFSALFFMEICYAQTIPKNIDEPKQTHKKNKPVIKKTVTPAIPKENIVESAIDIKPFTEGLAIAKLNDTSWCIINRSGDKVTTILKKYIEVHSFSAGLALVKNNLQWGYIDKTGREVIPAIYSYAGDFSEGLAYVCNPRSGKYGYIDSTMKEIIPFKYTRVNSFHNGLAMVKNDYSYLWIDKSGTPLVIKIHYSVSDDKFSDGLCEVILWGNYGADKRGFINTRGEEAVPLKYDNAHKFSNGMALVKLKEKWLYIDPSGKEMIWLKNNYADEKNNFSDDLAAIDNDGKWGFINKAGIEIIPSKYFDIQPFSEGLGAVMLYDKWGFIDKTGTEIIPLIYDKVYPFSDGLTFAWLNGARILIDKTGKKIK